MQKYKWVILGVVILFLSVSLVYKEGFVEQSGKYIYSTTNYDNQKYKGNNLGDKIPDINSKKCFNACIEDSDCTGYVIDSSYCQLKKGVIKKSDLNDDDNSSTIIINKNKKNLELKKNKNFDGEPLKEYKKTTYTECYDYCIDNGKCAGFVTNFEEDNESGKCILYSKDILKKNKLFKEDDKYTTLLN